MTTTTEPFPENLADRSRYILDCVKAGDYHLEWYPLQVTPDLTVFVSSDALKIHGVRVNVSAYLQQQIADHLGALLPTTEIADLIYVLGDRISPTTLSISRSVASMRKHSEGVDAKLSALTSPRKGLASNTGKHWVLDNNLLLLKPRFVLNYGWHLPPGARGDLVPSLRKVDGVPLRLIQSRGSHHDDSHTDYSQTATFVGRICQWKGESVFIEDILSKEGNPLTWDRKPLRVLRIPFVPLLLVHEPRSGFGQKRLEILVRASHAHRGSEA